MKRAPRSRQRHDLYAKYHDYDSEISDLLGECGIKKNGAPEHPSDLLKHAAVTAGTASWVFSDGDQSFTVHPQGRFKADNAYVLTEAAASGLGVVAMGEMIAGPYVEAGKLVSVMANFRLPDVGIFVVRPPSQHTPRKVRLLIDLMVERFTSGT